MGGCTLVSGCGRLTPKIRGFGSHLGAGYHIVTSKPLWIDNRFLSPRTTGGVNSLSAAMAASPDAKNNADTMSQLYGHRASVQERWPTLSSTGEIWEQIDTCYPKSTQYRPWFLADGTPAISGSPLNPRQLRSAQRKYMKRIMQDGYDPEGRGLPQGHEGDTPSETLLLGGKQLAQAFYLAHKADPQNVNVVRALKCGYQVCIRPKNMPRDVMEEIVRHNNRNNKGVRDTLPQLLLAVPIVDANFLVDLDRKSIDPSQLPTKGMHTLHKLRANFIADKHSEFGSRFNIRIRVELPESCCGDKNVGVGCGCGGVGRSWLGDRGVTVFHAGGGGWGLGWGGGGGVCVCVFFQ